MTPYINHKLEQFDKEFVYKGPYGNDPIDDFDIDKVRNFLSSALEEQHTQLVQEFVEVTKETEKHILMHAHAHVEGTPGEAVPAVAVYHIKEWFKNIYYSYSSLLPNNKEETC